MSWLSDRQARLFGRRLEQDRRDPTPRPGQTLNLESAQRILVLFPADEAANRKTIEAWKEKMRRAKRIITLYGVFEKDFGDATFDFTAISPKERNWFQLPKGEMTERFRNEEADLLLRLGPPDDPRLDYLAAISAAQLKVGPFHPGHTPIYQLQFDGKANADLNDQLNAIGAIFEFTNAKPSPL